MEVILLERIEKLGQMGDVVKVKDGFARNFLLPQKKALRASEDNLAYFEKEKVTLEANNLKQKQEAEVILKKLDNFNLIIIRQAGETGQLYGSVNTNDIKTSLDENGFIVEKNQIKLVKPIKELGVHNVSVKLHPEVQATISVIISRTDAEAEILLKGDEINIENNEDLTEEGVMNIEEVFEDGAVPENIGEEIEDSSEKVEDKKDEIDAEEFNNEIISETNNPEKEEEDNS
jgi:large subunit ribosomal protein L9|tara:strand:- start:57 stop:752 length:696 start_codon:yes stop_codon:yes gene_type:complete